MFYTPREQTNWIDLRNESDFKINERKTTFEYLVDYTIRLKDTTSCMVAGKSISEITFSPCFKETDCWIFDENTNQIISEKKHKLSHRDVNTTN
jgi:hypothetical protein